MSAIEIKVDNVSKAFKLPHEKQSSVKGLFLNIFRLNRTFEKQQVLKDISFEVKQGEFFGIVGRNGSGKSTLLKLLAGIYATDEGSIHIGGKLTPFIELGVGFNPELTGRQNVYLNGALLGFSRKEMDGMYQDIVDFAEIENFMDQKLKNYSSGMQVRLAFSIAIRGKSDILLIDEVLAVGDAAFQTKCFDYFYKLKKKGTTVVFVSHDRSSLERFCERGILVDQGRIIEAGSIQKVLKSYSKIVLEEISEVKTELDAADKPRIKTKYAEIISTGAYDEKGNVKRKFTHGDYISVKYSVKVGEDLVNPILGVTIWQKNLDKAIYASNTLIDGEKESGLFQKGTIITFESKLPPLLNDGEYYIEPAIANESASVFYDQQPRAATFFISGSKNPHSVISAQEHILLGKR